MTFSCGEYFFNVIFVHTNVFQGAGENRKFQATYREKSQKNLDAKLYYYFDNATKFEHFWDI